MGVMKMGNIATRVGTEPTYLAFWPSVLTISPPRLPDVTTPSVYDLPADYYTHLPWNCKSFNAYKYI